MSGEVHVCLALSRYLDIQGSLSLNKVLPVGFLGVRGFKGSNLASKKNAAGLLEDDLAERTHSSLYRAG